MGLEAVTWISDFNTAWPIGASDLKQQGDEHLRNIKLGIKNTFPNITGAVTVTHTELNGIKNASNLNAGTLPDARLSANVAMRNAVNVFTASPIELQSNPPEYIWNNVAAGAGLKKWAMQGEVDGDLTIFTRNDAGGGVENALQITRNAASEVTGFNLFGDVITVNSQDVRNTALFTAGTLGLARGGTGQTTQAGITRQNTLAWTIQSDPGGTPAGTAGDVFAYY